MCLYMTSIIEFMELKTNFEEQLEWNRLFVDTSRMHDFQKILYGKFVVHSYYFCYSVSQFSVDLSLSTRPSIHLSLYIALEQNYFNLNVDVVNVAMEVFKIDHIRIRYIRSQLQLVETKTFGGSARFV